MRPYRSSSRGAIRTEVTGKDGGLESILEVRSLEVNCWAERVSRFMDPQQLQM